MFNLLNRLLDLLMFFFKISSGESYEIFIFRSTWFHILCKELFIVLGVHWLDFTHVVCLMIYDIEYRYWICLLVLLFIIYYDTCRPYVKIEHLLLLILKVFEYLLEIF